ncbi:MAG: DoxX family membrane protein [Muribaculaceae bacterium]|nr:DoxX family membrane protein [Muribaculaceae bacterium]
MQSSASSNSLNSAENPVNGITETEKDSYRQPFLKPWLIVTLTWLCRLCVGVTFMFSGWAKAIDVWGFIYKIEEYLNVWRLYQPRELVLVAALTLSVGEFAVGTAVITGCLRRVSVWCAALMMCFLLPLTIYIYIADPVADCGCFGEIFIISNGATLLKNIILSAMIAFLLFTNTSVQALYRRTLQWIPLTLSVAYALILGLMGYHIQPLVDVRPYPVGTDLGALLAQHDTAADAQVNDMLFVYEKDGKTITVDVDNIPDEEDGWTFVRRQEAPQKQAAPQELATLAIFDDQDEDVTAEVISRKGAQILLVVTEPGVGYLTRARLADELAAYAVAHGAEMTALVATDNSGLQQWRELALPSFDSYMVDDTDTKELVRGNTAVVMLQDGVIKWKRNIASLDANMMSDASHAVDPFGLEPIDDGRLHTRLTLAYVIAMVLTGLGGLSRRTYHLRRLRKRRIAEPSESSEGHAQ